MGTRGRILLMAAALIAALLARLFDPAAAEKTRGETARLLADDLNNLQLVEALGRTAAQGAWREALVEVIGREASTHGA